MKKYDVTLTAHYRKTVCVYAESPEQAKEKTKIILFDTDLIHFSDEDGCEENTATNEDMEEDDCSGCPYFCPVCGECMYEDGCGG